MDLIKHKHNLALFLIECFPLTQVDESKRKFAAADLEELIDSYIEAAQEEEDSQSRLDAIEEERQFDKEAGNIAD